MRIVRRAAERILGFVVRLTPAGSREWGAALRRELDEIDGDWPALLWALGGAGAVVRHALAHLPAHGERRARLGIGMALAALALAVALLTPARVRRVSIAHAVGAGAVDVRTALSARPPIWRLGRSRMTRPSLRGSP